MVLLGFVAIWDMQLPFAATRSRSQTQVKELTGRVQELEGSLPAEQRRG